MAENQKYLLMNLRIGSGIDFHQLVAGRDLWIGGILIPHHKGALGHSDADVLLHAICDALLGALSLGDIGKQTGKHNKREMKEGMKRENPKASIMNKT